MSTDWHINKNNTETIKGLVRQQIEISKELDINTNLFLGDMVVSRQSQELIVLRTIEDILDMFEEVGVDLIAIAGNHEKTNYDSEDSFLSPFKYHPALQLVENYTLDGLNLDGYAFHFIPFFSEDVWLEKFKIVGETPSGARNYLISHIGLQGSVNNDGSKHESVIKPSMFKDFDKVFLGHFHQMHQISKNIFHIPSIRPANFGENNDKGVTVLYDDGSHELIKLKFQEYHTVKIDLTSTSKKEINELKKEHAGSENNIRFKFIGDESTNKSISKEEFESVGIKVETELKELQYEEADYQVEKLDKMGIEDEFKEYCEREDKDYETGKKYLDKKLK